MPGGSREQTIIVKMVTDQAEQKARAFASAQATRSKTQSTNDAKAAKAFEDSYVRAIYKAMAAEKQLADQKTKALKKGAAEQKNSDDAYVRAIRKRVNDEERIAKSGAAATKKANEDVNRVVAELQREQTRERSAALREQTAAVTTATRNERMQMAVAHRAKMMEWDLEQAAINEQRSAMTAAGGAVLGYVGAFAGLAGVATVLKGIDGYMAAIRKDAIDAANETTHFREAVLELAAMKNELGNAGPEMRRQVAIAAQTSQSHADALEMSKKYEGAAQAVIGPGKNLTREDATKGYIAAARLQAMEGPGSGSAYGRLYGTIALEANKGTTGEQLAARVNKEFRIQQPGAFSSMQEYAVQRNEMSGYVKNGMLTADEAAGLITAASLAANPQEAATHLKQGMAGLAMSPMRAREMTMLAGQEDETMSSAKYFRDKLHVDLKHDRPMAMLDKVVKDLQDEEAKAIGRKEVWNPHVYLGEHGVRNREEREFYMDQLGLRNKGTWKSVQERMDEPEDPKAITRTYDERKGREQALITNRAKNKEISDKMFRAEAPEAQLQARQRASFSKLYGESKISGTFEDWQSRNNSWLGSGMNRAGYVLGMAGDDRQVNLGAQEELLKEAKRIGVPATRPHILAGGLNPGQQYMGDEAMGRLQGRIQAAGGDPLGDIAKGIEKTNRLLEAIERKREGAPPAPGAAALGGKPMNLPPPRFLDAARMAGA